jgi:hypothetical protein
MEGTAGGLRAPIVVGVGATGPPAAFFIDLLVLAEMPPNMGP